MESTDKNNSLKTQPQDFILNYSNINISTFTADCRTCNRTIYIADLKKHFLTHTPNLKKVYIASSSCTDLQEIKSAAERLTVFGATCFDWWSKVKDIKENDIFSRFDHGVVDTNEIINSNLFWYRWEGTGWTNAHCELGIAIGYNHGTLANKIHTVVSGSESLLSNIFLTKCDKVFLDYSTNSAHLMAETYIKKYIKNVD